MLHIRLRRIGKKKQPQYRMIVCEKTKDPLGDYLENLGTYNPRVSPSEINLKEDRIKEWISKGAQCSDTVWNILLDQGVVKGEKRKTIELSKKRKVKVAEKADAKKAKEEEAKAAAQEAPAEPPAAPEEESTEPAEAPAEAEEATSAEAPVDEEPKPAEEPPAEATEEPKPAEEPAEEPKQE